MEYEPPGVSASKETSLSLNLGVIVSEKYLSRYTSFIGSYIKV